MTIVYKDGVYTNVRNGGAAEVITPVNKYSLLLAAGSSNVLVAAVAGQKIRLLIAFIENQGTNPSYAYVNDGTTNAFYKAVPSNAVYSPPIMEHEAGFYETAVGAALNADIGPAPGTGLYISTKYLIYTP